MITSGFFLIAFCWILFLAKWVPQCHNSLEFVRQKFFREGCMISDADFLSLPIVGQSQPIAGNLGQTEALQPVIAEHPSPTESIRSRPTDLTIR